MTMDSQRILAAFGFREGKNKACMEKALAGNWADVIRTMQADNCSPRKAAKVLGYDPSLVLGAMISHPETAQAITAVIWLRHDIQHLAPVYQGIVDKYLADRE